MEKKDYEAIQSAIVTLMNPRQQPKYPPLVTGAANKGRGPSSAPERTNEKQQLAERAGRDAEWTEHTAGGAALNNRLSKPSSVSSARLPAPSSRRGNREGSPDRPADRGVC